MRRLLLILLLALSPPLAASPLQVLFIGNSYTYTHNLPEVFRRVAAAAGKQVAISELTAPGVAIEDHFRSGALPGALRGDWDLVVLQQGPSSLPENRQHLVHWTGEVARHLDRSRTRIVMYSVWPASEHLHTWSNAETSYRLAALESRGCVFPAAAAWRLALADDPGLALYSSDGLHPTREGVMLAALTLSRALWPRQHKALDGRLQQQFGESAWQTAVTLAPRFRELAARAVAESGPRCSK